MESETSALINVVAIVLWLALDGVRAAAAPRAGTSVTRALSAGTVALLGVGPGTGWCLARVLLGGLRGAVVRLATRSPLTRAPPLV
jgi:Na+-transporting NADH:ubiquinone oxidoreductase subunit NqrE